jgi:hypothetical protein
MATKQPEIKADDIGADMFLDPDQTPQKPATRPKTTSRSTSKRKTSKAKEAESSPPIKGTYYLPPEVDQMLRKAYGLRIQTERGAKINDIIVEALRKYLPKLLREQSSGD